VEQKFKKKRVKHIRFYESYPNYFMPGIDPLYTEATWFFERFGYKKMGTHPTKLLIFLCKILIQELKKQN